MKIIDCEQYSNEWWKARLGKPSASNAKKLVTSTGLPSKSLKDYGIELANDLYVGEAVDQWEGNVHTQRGTELEAVARSLYELIRGTQIGEVGMFINDGEQYIASPDGVIEDKGILEIKCLTATRHTKAILYYAKHKKVPSDYCSQLQMQLFVSGYKYAHYMFYHPDLPELIIRVYPDLSFHGMLFKQLGIVIKERDRIIKLLEAA